MKELIYAVMVFTILVAILFLGIVKVEEAKCDVQAASFNSHEFTILGSCMVEYEGRMLPLKNIRGFGDNA